MIRVALFISLVALFYYYCKEDDSANNRLPNDINMIEVPVDVSPTFYYESFPEATLKFDSSAYSNSSQPSNL